MKRKWNIEKKEQCKKRRKGQREKEGERKKINKKARMEGKRENVQQLLTCTSSLTGSFDQGYEHAARYEPDVSPDSDEYDPLREMFLSASTMSSSTRRARGTHPEVADSMAMSAALNSSAMLAMSAKNRGE